MKNLYNTIEQNLKSGLNVVVKDLKWNRYCAISPSPFKDECGNYRMSAWYNSIEESKQWIGDCCGDSKEDWDNKDLEIVEVFRPEFEPFKIGQKVRLLDTIKETENWEDFENHFPKMTGEIEEFYNQVDGINYRVNGYIIGHEYLAPLAQEVEELTMEEVCKLLGREVKIKK